jgi:type IV pilus assembly protein PilQ
MNILKKLIISVLSIMMSLNTILAQTKPISLVDINIEDKGYKTKVIINCDSLIEEYNVDMIDEIPQLLVVIKNCKVKPMDLSVIKGPILRITTQQVDRDSRIIIKLIKKQPYEVKLTERNKLELAVVNPYHIYRITDVIVKEDKELSQVEIVTDGIIQEKHFPVGEPPRLFIDFLNATTTTKTYDILGKRIKKIELTQRMIDTLNIARIIIELNEAYVFETFKKDSSLLVNFKEAVPFIKEEVPKKIIIPEKKPEVKKEVPPKIKLPPKVEGIPKKVEGIPEKVEELPKEELIPKEEVIPEEEKVAIEEVPEVPIEVLVSMDFKDADLLDVLRLISHKAGVNIIPYSGVSGAVTLKIKDVPWEVALDMILKSQGYDYVWDRGVIRVGKPEQLVKETEVKILRLNYSEASKLLSIITPMLTKGVGFVQVDERTNSLIITDNPRILEEIEKLVKNLDKKIPQVMIEAKIVKLELDYEERLGFAWTYVSGKGEVSVPFGVLDRPWFKYAKVMDSSELNATLHALIHEGKGEILSNPKIITLNNEEARVISGKEIPILKATAKEGEVIRSWDFKEAGVKLTVKPVINPNKTVILKITPEVSAPYEWRQAAEQEIPVFSTERAETTLLVHDGETVVIGGVIKEDEETAHNKVPILGDLPVIGKIFKYSSKRKTKTELLIFLTIKVLV